MRTIKFYGAGILLLIMILASCEVVYGQVSRKRVKLGGKSTPSGSPADTQILIYDGVLGRWVYGANGAGGGDMLKATYDINDNGIVDNAESAQALTGSQATDITTNNAKVTYPIGDATKVSHISVTQAVDLDAMETSVGSNDTHRGRTDNPHNVNELDILPIQGTYNDSFLQTNGTNSLWVQMNKGHVGLGNVDNTSDVNKPISTATQTDLDNKAEKIDDLSDAKYDGSSLFLGAGAGTNDDGTNNKNVGVGKDVLVNNTTGFNNTANGYQSLYSNTSGNRNTANGYHSLYLNTTGSNNTANGYRSLYLNTNGSYNVANGYQSIHLNTNGNRNTANGYQSLYSNTNGNNNIAIGYHSLYSNTTGSNNTANGIYSGNDNTTGSNNVYIGYNTGRGIVSGSGNTILGANQVGLADTTFNEIRVSDGTGEVAFGVSSTNNFTIDVDGAFTHGSYDFNIQNGAAISGADAGGGWQTTSDSTLKSDILVIDSVLSRSKLFNKILATSVYQYRLKKSSLGWKQLGDIADSVTVFKETRDSVDYYHTIKNPEKKKQKRQNKKALRLSKKEHLGFMAQTFNKKFNRQKDNVVIDWADVSTIQWYAIQELIEKVRSQAKTIKDSKERLNDVEARLTALEKK